PPAFARGARKAAAPKPNGEGGRLHLRATARRAQRYSLVYVYILGSLEHVERHYVGVTADLRARLKHNAGEVSHTSKYVPWAVKTYLAFSDEKQAFAFEKYLKSPSGRAFAKKRL
ncbi:MAG TPA: GIY-YIG nuclease family protein, partial [Stellaceae bacterium]|nr:GIY-YIG nuclease family protein [Stellaceae bacterium]